MTKLSVLCNNMYRFQTFFYGSMGLAIFATLMLIAGHYTGEVNAAFARIALRDMGNKILLTQQDQTSLILPVQQINDFKYQVSFEKPLTIHPDSLVAIAARSFQKAQLPSEYQIEVKHCEDEQVAYSFLQFKNEEKSIVPCSGRVLPKRCYTIEVLFLKKTLSSTDVLLWTFLLVLGIVLAFVFFPKRVKEDTIDLFHREKIKFGRFEFYPDENKLYLESSEISLSKKEVELLTVFLAHINKVIKREELSKKVWEDHGVFVGRSLDTYISKLRKKLSDDESIKLTNVHGIGYMLEVKSDS